MTPLFKKFNLKDDTPSIVVLSAPASFDAELKALQGVKVHRQLAPGQSTAFAMAFVITQQALDEASAALAEAAEATRSFGSPIPRARPRTTAASSIVAAAGRC